MNERQIQCFLAAARTLNLTQAATTLYFSAQTVGKYISELERELHVRLFDRDNKGISLTKAGEQYARFFENQEKSLERVAKNIQTIYQRMSHSLAIGYAAWLDPFGEINRGIKQFRKNNPSISISGRQYKNKELALELEEGHLDLALISEGQVFLQSEFNVCPIANDELSLLVPVDACGKDWSGKPDPNCWGLPFFQSASWGAWEWSYIERKEIITRGLENIGLYPNKVEYMPNIQSVFACMKTNSGVTIDDRVFGYGSKIPGIRHMPLKHLRWCCIWRRTNENPLIPSLIKHLREYYHYDDAVPPSPMAFIPAKTDDY